MERNGYPRTVCPEAGGMAAGEPAQQRGGRLAASRREMRRIEQGSRLGLNRNVVKQPEEQR